MTADLAIDTSHGRRSVAVLVADVYGYSRLMRRDLEGTRARLTQALGLFRDLLADSGSTGLIEAVGGDAVVVLFENAAQAIHCALGFQRSFTTEDVWRSDQLPMSFRIGLHVGEVLVEPGQPAFGRAIFVASRLQALAPPGGICATEHFARSLGPDVRAILRPLGMRLLPGLDERVQISIVEGEALPWAGPLEPEDVAAPPATGGTSAIAVLPFVHVGSAGDVDDDVARWLQGQLIGNLCRFRDLSILSREAVDKLARRIDGADLERGPPGARYVIAGTVSIDREMARFAFTAGDIVTGVRLHAARYVAPVTDAAELCESAAAAIAARTANWIVEAERERVMAMPLAELDAQALVMRGQELCLTYQRDAVEAARGLFRDATALDPHYGRARASLARTELLAWRYRWTERTDTVIDIARRYALEGVSHDFLDAHNHAELGFIELYTRRFDRAQAAFAKALQQNPIDAEILTSASFCAICCGDRDRALALLTDAVRLCPEGPRFFWWNLGLAHIASGRLNEAIDAVHRMPDTTEQHRLLAVCHALNGDIDQARRHASEVVATDPGFTIAGWCEVLPLRDEAMLENLARGLRLSGLS